MDSAEIRTHVAYVKNDIRALSGLISKLEKPLTSPNWEHEAQLLTRQSERLRKALTKLEAVLVPPKPARAASARGEKSARRAEQSE